MGRKLNKVHAKEDSQMANKQMKGCSKSFVIRVLEIKRTIKFHYT